MQARIQEQFERYSDVHRLETWAMHGTPTRRMEMLREPRTSVIQTVQRCSWRTTRLRHEMLTEYGYAETMLQQRRRSLKRNVPEESFPMFCAPKDCCSGT